MNKIQKFTQEINSTLDPATIIMIIYYCIKLYLECKKNKTEIFEEFQKPGIGLKIALSRAIRKNCPDLSSSEQLKLRTSILQKAKGLSENEIQDIFDEYTTSM